MKSPLWILNSALMVLFIIIGSVLFWSRPERLPRAPLTVIPVKTTTRHESPTPDTAYIYQHDPFGTYSAPPPPGEADMKAQESIPLPRPPTMRQITQTPPTIPTFLPPIDLTLKGIISSQYERDSRAIIANKKSKQEALYKVGDVILDAEIIRIDANKVMLMRSNGQQETLFVSATDAHADPVYQQAEGLRSTRSPVKKIGENAFLVDPQVFTEQITNLAQFIDALDITTVYDQGRSIGCRVGSIASTSIGGLLGLEPGDIITMIHAIPTDTAHNRLAIYHHIRSLSLDDSLTMSVIRNNTTFEFTYQLSTLYPTNRPFIPIAEPAVPENIRKKSLRTPDKTMKQEMYKQDKRAMVEKGGRSSQLRSGR